MRDFNTIPAYGVRKGSDGMSQQRELEKLSNQLDWNLLRTFMVIVQEGSITAAAGRLLLTQPAVSLALKRLEERLGRRLIDRGPGRFEVTDAGEMIYREVVDIYGTISRFGVLVPGGSGRNFGPCANPHDQPHPDRAFGPGAKGFPPTPPEGDIPHRRHSLN